MDVLKEAIRISMECLKKSSLVVAINLRIVAVDQVGELRGFILLLVVAEEN